MIMFLKNNCYRVKSKKNYIIVSLLMTMVSIVFAVYLTSKVQVQGNIAVVTQSNVTVFQSQYIKFTSVKKVPTKYELVMGKYDGVLIDKGNGNYNIETIKNDDFKKMLELLVKNPKNFIPEIKETRGAGTNIIGFLLMFILIQGIFFMFTLAEDLELKQIERIVAAPISFIKYLLSHFIFSFLFIFAPTIIILAVMKYIFGFNLGFSLLQYVPLLSLICSFGVAFAMLINACIKVSDTANMLGASIIVLTTVLSGSFYSFDKGNKILEKALWVFPQKNILSFVQGLENGKRVSSMFFQLLYVILISLVFFIFSIIKIRKDYVFRKD